MSELSALFVKPELSGRFFTQLSFNDDERAISGSFGVSDLARLIHSSLIYSRLHSENSDTNDEVASYPHITSWGSQLNITLRGYIAARD